MMDGDDHEKVDEAGPPIMEVESSVFLKEALTFLGVVWGEPGAAVVIKSKGRANLVLQRLNDAE